MACARKSDREEILEVLKKMSGGNPTGAKRPKQPSLAAKTFGSDVRLVSNVAVPPIIVFNCLLLF